MCARKIYTDTHTLAALQQHVYIIGMQLGKLNLSGRVLSAPLAGISERPFRLMAIEFGAAAVFTEMISSEGIIRCQRKTLQMLAFRDDERPLGIQLFGSNPEVMNKAARFVITHYNPDIVDINFGCPVRKVVRKNGGAAVLKDLVLTKEIVTAVVEGAGDTSVSVKMRTGWDDSRPVYLEVGEIAQEAGVRAITLHARSRTGGFSSKADWSAIRNLKRSVDIIVIGNGDITGPEDAGRMIEQTGCDAVMIGRAALGNPYIFRQVHQFLETGVNSGEVSIKERIKIACRHAQLMVEEYGEDRGTKKMRRHLGWYVRGFRRAADLRQRLVRVEKLADIGDIFTTYLKGEG
ncbi:MAG: tRNA dihydrouridine synthase DusB [candidate division Zixibacteria bacterium]|nr:tRNA dihydrouridine synthase DusB [candidate division Zixibacteria bacterium]